MMVPYMMYLAFLIFCVAIVSIASVSVDVRKKALLLGCIGPVVAYPVELNGVLNHDWNYANVNSVLRVTGIPIEILFGYFTAVFFLVIIVTYLPRVSTKERRKELLQYFFLVIGVVFLIYAYVYESNYVLVGWSFLGIYGMSVSRDSTIPITVGMCAFLVDWAVEGMLTARVEYYSHGWDPSIALVFMFVSMFISGVLTHESLLVEDMSLDLGQKEPSKPHIAEVVASRD